MDTATYNLKQVFLYLQGRARRVHIWGRSSRSYGRGGRFFSYAFRYAAVRIIYRIVLTIILGLAAAVGMYWGF